MLMKKCISLFIAAVLLLLCSCSGKETEQKFKTADMLNITNTDKTFIGCRERYFAVIAAMKAKVDILEREHNNSIKLENENNFFLEKDYILTAFEPFSLEHFDITADFTADMTDEAAKSAYKLKSSGADIIYDSDGETRFSLRFVSEEASEEYLAEYDADADSFRYSFITEDSQGSHTEEYLEFSKTADGAYVIQSADSRCYIKFDGDDKIVSFVCGELRSEKFTAEESVFPVPDETVNIYWVLSKGKSSFSNIHSYEDGILTHEDCSSGPWKSIKIDAKNYESAFYS